MAQSGSGPPLTQSPATVKTSSKLALMKKRDEARDEEQQGKMTISPKKEPNTSSNRNKKVKSEATFNTVKISPKKPEVKASILFYK